MGSKVILNTSIINDKKQKIELEILFGLTHHSTKQYPQILQKDFLRSHGIYKVFNLHTEG